MKKRITAGWISGFLLVVFLLGAPRAALAACEHYQDTVMPEDLIRVNAVPPGIGTEGWSGDGYCPLCGALCEPGVVIPAFTDPDAGTVTPTPRKGPTPSPPRP